VTRMFFNGKVTDTENGIYVVTYVAEHSGFYTLEVTVNGVAIVKSPFKVNVRAGKICSDTSSLIGEAQRSGVKSGGHLFKLQGKDRYGNNKILGGDDVAVYLTKPIRRPARVIDNDDGTYTIKHPYGLEKGDYAVHVSIGGQMLKPGVLPEHVDVEDADPVDEEDSAQILAALPNTGTDILKLLAQLEPEKRKAFIAELKKHS